MIKASVIMPVYNGERYIKEAIESIVHQTYKDFELIIINDGSADSTLEIISIYSDSRIKLLNLKHAGLVNALNQGIKKSTGKYIIRFDADDISMSNRIERLINTMESDKELLMCGSWAEIINENGEKIGEMKYPPLTDSEIRRYVLLHSPFIHPSVIVKRDTLIKVGGYKKFRHIEDYELWTRIIQAGRVCNLPEYLIKYRIHNNQVTSKNRLIIRLRGIMVRILAVWRVFL